ncbi:MAG TPA: hypothetical protein VH300_00290 [Thermoleophilaceae bacterium]|jgi:hypothetical protein|nr:hypothetical protein [Thermoleophilaceae bacterium]
MPKARAALLVLLIAALAPMTVGAAIPRPTPVSPKNGAQLTVDKTPTFQVRSTGEGTVWVHVSKSAKRSGDGVIGNDAVIVQAHKKGKYYVVKPKFFNYPGFWANQKKKWYWQAYRIACGEEPKSSDCKVEGPVRRFRLR